MPKIGTHIKSTDIPCDRCGSKRRISKTWTERIKNDYGVMVLLHTQIVCTNKACQKEFDDVIKKDAEKREALKQAKLVDAAKREVIKQADIAKKTAKFSATPR